MLLLTNIGGEIEAASSDDEANDSERMHPRGAPTRTVFGALEHARECHDHSLGVPSLGVPDLLSRALGWACRAREKVWARFSCRPVPLILIDQSENEHPIRVPYQRRVQKRITAIRVSCRPVV